MKKESTKELVLGRIFNRKFRSAWSYANRCKDIENNDKLLIKALSDLIGNAGDCYDDGALGTIINYVVQDIQHRLDPKTYTKPEL